MLKPLDVQRDYVPATDVGLAIDRWQLRLLGCHCATLYRYDLILRCDHLSIWSLHVSPLDKTGFGIAPPPWFIRLLGLSRDYSHLNTQPLTGEA